MTIRTTLIVLLLAFCVSANGQEKYGGQLQGFSGQYISHAINRQAPEQRQYGVAIDFFRKTAGKKYWQFAHNYPSMGLSFTARSLGNNRVYGNAYSVLPWLEFDVIRFRKSAFQIKHGTGLAIIDRKYHPVQNPKNVAISTTLNATSVLDFGYRIYLTEHTGLKAGYIIHHYSNGGFKLPNSGMNTGSFYAALAWYGQGWETGETAHAEIKAFNRWRYRVATGSGFSNYRGNGNIDWNLQLNGMAFLQHNTRFRTGLGIESGRLNKGKVQTTLYLEEEVQFGNLATRYGFGGYLIHKNERGEDFYSKIGIAWYPKVTGQIPTGFFVGSMLKAHGFKAAFVELNTGFVF